MTNFGPLKSASTEIITVFTLKLKANIRYNPNKPHVIRPDSNVLFPCRVDAFYDELRNVIDSPKY